MTRQMSVLLLLLVAVDRGLHGKAALNIGDEHGSSKGAALAAETTGLEYD